MLHPEKVHTALAAKQNHFAGAQKAISAELEAFQTALKKLAALDPEACDEQLAGVERPGARPTSEFGQAEGLTIPFAPRWANHAQARSWARRILEGVATFAVDGSQIPPTKDLSIPVALIQIGWFENPHLPGGEYIKDVAVEVLSPIDLAESFLNASELGGAVVNLRRFKMEVERIVEYLHQNADTNPSPLALLDGTLIVSFAGLMQETEQEAYTNAVIQMIESSEATHVPLAGFVDSSSAHDLVDLIGHLTSTRRSSQITDATLLQNLMGWGDRSQIFICARDDNLHAHDYYESVCFCYLKTTADLPPARVEFPRWVFESGDHERLLDLVRAECIVGTGYPYALETADAVAVIDLQDRERFYRLLQRFTSEGGYPLRFTRKSISKRGRRL